MYSSTTDPSIVCAPQVCVCSVKLYRSVKFCTQKYSPSIQVVDSRTVYLYMNLYIFIKYKVVCVFCLYELGTEK